MDFDFTPYFERYRGLVAMADSIFDRMEREFPDAVTCKLGCDDCCHALFDLSLVEAIYLNHRFNDIQSEPRRREILEAADRADRRVYKIKRDAYKRVEAGEEEGAVLEEIAAERVRCPLLDEGSRCLLYEHRPITCRLYGIPTAIGGKGHTCGLSGFARGEAYPTVNVDVLHKKLYEISAELVQSLQTRYVRMADMLVPLSMALLTTYDEVYLGMADDPEAERKEGGGRG